MARKKQAINMNDVIMAETVQNGIVDVTEGLLFKNQDEITIDDLINNLSNNIVDLKTLVRFDHNNQVTFDPKLGDTYHPYVHMLLSKLNNTLPATYMSFSADIDAMQVLMGGIFKNHPDKMIVSLFNTCEASLASTCISVYKNDKGGSSYFALDITSNQGVIYFFYDPSILNDPADSLFFKLMSFLKQNQIKIDRTNKAYIDFITVNQRGYDTVSHEIVCDKINLKSNYNDDLSKVDSEICKYLNRDGKNSGLIILNGDPGTGKTYYLRHLASKVEDRPIIFIPSNVAHIITEPDFLTFLMECQDSILIIEDAEPVLASRDDISSRSSSISNILNITEGILSDALNITIIATFNCNLDNIDKALLRKGRLFKHYKFEKLSVDKSNKLLKKLKKKHVTDVPMSLAEIYNYGEENGAECITLTNQQTVIWDNE